MREIKVRFWDEVNKKFWFGGQEGESDGAETFQTWFDNGVLKGFMYEEVSYGFSPIDDVKHRDLITSQWTGLKDKNGKEIYEGDICETVTYSGKPFGTIDVVKFSGGAFKLTDIEDALLPIPLDDSAIQSVEVIGNIFEHPHLIGGIHG